MLNSAGEITQATVLKLPLATILLARPYFFILSGRFRLEINSGDFAIAASPLERFADVRSMNPAGRKQSGDAAHVPLRSISSPTLVFFRPLGRIRRSRNKGDSAGMAALHTFCATVGLRPA